MGIEDEPRHLVRFIGYHGLIEQSAERQIGECHSGADAFPTACRRKAGEPVTGAIGRGAREKRAQVLENMARSASVASVRHEYLCSPRCYNFYCSVISG